MATNYNNIANAEIYNMLLERKLKTAEEISLDGKKLVGITREDAIALLKKHDEENVTKFPVLDAEGKEIKQVTEDEASKDKSLVPVKNQELIITHYVIKNEPEDDTKKGTPWSQETQAEPGKYYAIPRRLKEVKNGKKIYEELPSFYIDGRWYEDEKGTVECSFYTNLQEATIEKYKAEGIIR